MRQGCSYVARVLLPMLEAMPCVPSHPQSQSVIVVLGRWGHGGQQFMVTLCSSVILRGQHRLHKILSKYKQQLMIFSFLSFYYFKYAFHLNTVYHRSYHIEEFNIQTFNQNICPGQGMEVIPTFFTLKSHQILSKWPDNNVTKAILIVAEIYPQIQNFSFI